MYRTCNFLKYFTRNFVFDKELYELKLEVPYTCCDQPFILVLVESDLDVYTFFGITSQESIPLCVPIKKCSNL